MYAELSVQGTATSIEGPLLFMRRNVDVGLNDAVDVIAGLIEQGFHDLASEYRDFIIGQLEKAKAKAGS